MYFPKIAQFVLKFMVSSSLSLGLKFSPIGRRPVMTNYVEEGWCHHSTWKLEGVGGTFPEV